MTAVATMTTKETRGTGTSVRCQVEMVSPAWARMALGLHENVEESRGHTLNRGLRKERVLRYTGLMRDGLWHLNGEPIQFSGDRILNGQHRLHAVVASGLTVPMVVVRGVSEEAFVTLDQGMPRNLADLVGSRGVPYGQLLTAGASFAWTYEQHQTMDLKELGAASRPNPQVLASFVMRDMPRWEAAALAARRVYKLVSRPSVLAALHYLVSPNYSEAVSTFIGSIETGANLSPDRPVYMLRERMMRDRLANVTKMDSGVVAAIAVKAWNAEVAGTTIKQLKHRRGVDAFPVLTR